MEGLEFAHKVLREEPWLPTPLLKAQTIGTRLNIDLWLKLEGCTPIGSFKLRGALVAMANRREQLTEEGVWVVSSGNYGLGTAYAGQRNNVKVTVVVPEGASPSKLERIRTTGAQLIARGKDGEEAKEWAMPASKKAGGAYWEDGVIDEMAQGASTIATEILDHSGPWDYVTVPVGNGSLIRGISTVFKERSPRTKIIGLVSSGSPAMYFALTGKPWDESAGLDTIADGLAVRIPIPGTIEPLQALIDEVWLVEESKLVAAIRTLMELEQVMVEPASAICIAGIVEHRQELAGSRVAAIMTGAHLRMSLLPQVEAAKSLI